MINLQEIEPACGHERQADITTTELAALIRVVRAAKRHLFVTEHGLSTEAVVESFHELRESTSLFEDNDEQN